MNNQLVTNTYTYSRMDAALMNQVSFIYQNTGTFQLIKFKPGTNPTSASYQTVAEDFGFGQTIDAVQFEEFGVYKDSNET
jgi:hypothetical protein